MIRISTVVKNRAGVHARPASLIVQTAGQFESNIFFEKESEKINAKSIMGILTMGAAYNTHLDITAEGPDEQEAAEAIHKLFETRFEEE